MGGVAWDEKARRGVLRTFDTNIHKNDNTCKNTNDSNSNNSQNDSNNNNPKGSTYTTIRELGPIIPSVVWYSPKVIYIYIYMDPLGILNAKL